MIVDLCGTPLAEARTKAARFVRKTAERLETNPETPLGFYRFAEAGQPFAGAQKGERLARGRYRNMVALTDKLEPKIRRAMRHLFKRLAAAALESGLIEAEPTLAQRKAAFEAQIIAITGAELADEIWDVVEDAVEYGVDSVTTEIAAFNVAAEVSATFDMDAVAAKDAAYSRVAQFASEVAQREQAAIKELVFNALDGQYDINTLADAIAAHFEDGVHASPSRTIPLEAWSELVARTEVSHAQNAAIMAGYAAGGVESIQWIAADDERTCPECSDLDGEIVKLGDPFPDSDDGVDSPPAHPACRCSTIGVYDDSGFGEEVAA